MKLDWVCSYCEKPFVAVRQSTRGKRTYRAYCSIECRQSGLKPNPCVVIECERQSRIHGLCSKHYKQEMRKNDRLFGCTRIDKVCKNCGVTYIATSRNQMFCSRACKTLSIRPNVIYRKGYRKISLPHHPRADKRGYVSEHLLVMEQKIGRPIDKEESIHHIDNCKVNNHPDNLQLFENHGKHVSFHRQKRTSC